MKVKPFNIIALLVFAAVVAAIGWNIVSDNRKGHYLTASPEIRTIEKRVSVPGHVYPAREIEIKSQLSGVLDSILVKTGDFVSAGDPVATVRLVKRAYYLKKGCLAGSARTDNAHHLAFVYVQVDSLEYLQ